MAANTKLIPTPPTTPAIISFFFFPELPGDDRCNYQLGDASNIKLLFHIYIYTELNLHMYMVKLLGIKSEGCYVQHEDNRFNFVPPRKGSRLVVWLFAKKCLSEYLKKHPMSTARAAADFAKQPCMLLKAKSKHARQPLEVIVSIHCATA